MKKRLFLSPPWTGREERRAVLRAFASGYVAPCGPQVDEFERQIAALAGRKHAVAVSGGTAALELLMDEYSVDDTWTVIAPTLTFIASVAPAARRGANLVFVDCDETGNIDVALVEQALARCRASKVMVIGVDLYGRCCAYAALERLCRRYGAVFLLDSAEAVGSRCGDRASGKAGKAAIYSFNGNKIITTSGGGAIVTDDAKLAARARKRSQQSREEVPWYEHHELGHNFRLSNLLAAVGIAQLAKLPQILAARQRHYDYYAQSLPRPLLPPVAGENHWLNVVRCTSQVERDRVLAALAADNVEARMVWKPMHLQAVFARCKYLGGKKAEDLFNTGVCLPSGTGLLQADLRRVVTAFKRGIAGA